MAKNGLMYDPTLLKFYRSVAEKCGLLEEDIEFIFGIQKATPTQLEDAQTKIKFHLQDDYEVSFDHELDGNAISISAENQRNKTTSLLCIATLLGYSWSDKQNLDFLGDEEFVNKGLALRKSLEEGREAYIELTRNDRLLKVHVTEGRATVQYHDHSDQRPFNLQKGFAGFERYVQDLIDVQLVSKGRNFIQRIEADVLDEIIKLGKVLDENSEQAFTRAVALSKSLPTQIGSVDSTLKDLRSKISKTEQEIEQKRVEKTPYTAGQNTVGGIIVQLENLSLQELDKIRQLHWLEQQLDRVEESERNQTEQRELLVAKEEEIASLEQEHQNLCQKRDTLETAFNILRAGIVDLIDNRQIKSAPEIKTLQERIEQFDINGVCSMYAKNLEPASLEVYQALVEAIETTVSDNVAIVPLREDICDTNSLLQWLYSGREKTQNLIALNTIISKFMAYLEKHGIDLNLTPNDFYTLQAHILEYEDDLHSERAELKTLQEQDELVSSVKKLSEVEKQIQQINQSLSEEAKLIKSEVEDTVGSLDEPLTLTLNEIWSVNGLDYLQRRQKEWQDFSRNKLSLKINKLTQDVDEWQVKLQRLETGTISVDTSDPNHIKDFQTNATYIVGTTKSMLQNVDSPHRGELREQGLEESLQEAIDQVITQRCHYYYKNVGDNCLQIPLGAIVYHQKGRNAVEFYVEGKALSGADLSGGTQSVMTVRSLASKPSSKPFGGVLLVDEWGDVEQIGEPLYAELKQMETILLAVFVKVENFPTLTIKSIN